MDRQAASGRNDSIRAVERAIDLLQALNRRPLSTLHDLHRDTGFPKSSIVRLLRTLEAKGLAAQSPVYGTYHLLGRVKSLASGFHHEPLIIQAADEIMIDFTKREGWPLALALFELNAMIVRACTIRYTSLSLEHASLNRRLSMVRHAMGRAYLAYSEPNEQEILLEILKNSQDPNNAAAQDSEAMAHLIEQVKERGFATRDPFLEPRSSTIAVPVRENGCVVACLGFTWITAAMSLQKAAEQYVPRLLTIAESISKALTGFSEQIREPWPPLTGEPMPRRQSVA